MAVRYYSDRLNRFFDTMEEANRAEFESKEKENLAKIQQEREARELKEKKEKDAAERKALAEKVDIARKAMVKAQSDYQAVLSEFVNKYHTYHYSTDNANEVPLLFSIFNDIFKF